MFFMLLSIVSNGQSDNNDELALEILQKVDENLTPESFESYRKLYIPNVGRPIRITSMQSVVGGVFNNSDIMRLDYSVEYDPSILEQNQKEYILDLQAKTRTIAYDKLKMWVDKNNNMVTKVECYTASGKMIKTLEFKEIKNFGDGIMRPAVIETSSPLYKGYRSIMIYSGMKARKLLDEVFTFEFLSRLEELR